MSDDATLPEYLIQVAAELIPTDPDDNTTIIGWEQHPGQEYMTPLWGSQWPLAKAIVGAVLQALAADTYKMAGWANEGDRLDSLADDVLEVEV